MATNYVTAGGLQKLKEELQHLESVERPRVIAAIAEAREKGDLSENDFKKLARLCDWDYQKFDQPETFEYTAAELIKSHLDKGYDPKPVTIKSGYIYHYRQRNGGGLLVMYDLNSQRLYTRSNPR